jgi:hypothetical protein
MQMSHRHTIQGSPRGSLTAARRLGSCRALLAIGIGLIAASQCASAATGCGNPVQCENLNTGSTVWQVNTTARYGLTLTGYSAAPSVARGAAIEFYIRAPGPYLIQIIRLGYYQGQGGRILDSVSKASGQSQPACRWLLAGTPNEYYSCDNWSQPVSYTIPPTWVSGVYLALLTAKTATDTFQYYIPFVVRDDNRHADFLYQEAVATDQAYNGFYDGAFTPPSPSFALTMSNTSLYSIGNLANFDHNPANVVYKVSFDRPYGRVDGMALYRYEQPFIYWLEKNGYDVVYATDIDTHEGHEALTRYKGLLIAGHSEYWSKQMYDSFLVARNAGVNIAFFGGDSVYWQARFEQNVEQANDRIMVCFRRPNPLYAQPGSIQPPAAAADPNLDPQLQTIYWRDPPVARDEQTVVGVHKANPHNGPSAILGWISFSNSELVVNAPQPLTVKNHDNWVYVGTGLKDGDSIGQVYGQEADSFETRPTGPAHQQPYTFLDPPFQPPPARLGTFAILGDTAFVVPAHTIGPTVNTTIYQACSGAWVFAAGSVMWPNALAPSPPIGATDSMSSAAQLITADYSNTYIQQMSANVLNVFNGSRAPPRSGTCPADPVMATAATD